VALLLCGAANPGCSRLSAGFLRLAVRRFLPQETLPSGIRPVAGVNALSILARDGHSKNHCADSRVAVSFQRSAELCRAGQRRVAPDNAAPSRVATAPSRLAPDGPEPDSAGQRQAASFLTELRHRRKLLKNAARRARFQQKNSAPPPPLRASALKTQPAPAPYRGLTPPPQLLNTAPPANAPYWIRPK